MDRSDVVDQYLKGLPADQRDCLQQLRESIARLIPDGVEAISYGIPAFKVAGNAVAGFSAAKGHLAYHPMSGATVESLAELLQPWSTSKGTIRFQPDHPLTDDVIEALLARRMQELTVSSKGAPGPAPRSAKAAAKAATAKAATAKAATAKAANDAASSTAASANAVFNATLIQAEGMKATGIVVPPEILAALGRGKKPAVSVTLNGHTFRTTIGSMNGNAMIGVSADVRKTAGLQAGDDVAVRLEVADAPREVAVPDDFAAAMKANPPALAFFGGLANSLQRFHIDNINGAKTPETRVRRIAKSVELFLAGKQR